jgi:hypothetical protein
VQEIIEEHLPKDMAHASTPAASHLFEVNDNQVKLNLQQSNLFHQVTASYFFYARGQDRIYRLPSHF